MRFTDAHSIGSVCVPSRLGIMTGRYAWRFGKPPVLPKNSVRVVL
jgi:arylsulfatase A-like enzyme